MSIEPEDPIAENILEEFLTFMKGFVSLPVYIPGNAYAKAVKVLIKYYSVVYPEYFFLIRFSLVFNFYRFKL